MVSENNFIIQDVIDKIKKAIDEFRMDEEEQIDGKYYVESSCICAELANGNVIDKVVEKYLFKDSVILTNKQYEELNKGIEIFEEDFKGIDEAFAEMSSAVKKLLIGACQAQMNSKQKIAEDILMPIKELCQERGTITFDDLYFLYKRFNVGV